jgi:hypothetical protein
MLGTRWFELEHPVHEDWSMAERTEWRPQVELSSETEITLDDPKKKGQALRSGDYPPHPPRPCTALSQSEIHIT